MSNKIKTAYYLIYKYGDLKSIEGRPLGLIDRLQFYHLYNEPKKFVRKLLSCPQISLNDIADNKLDVKQCRFIFSTIDDRFVRRLFVSSELSHISTASTIRSTVVDLELVDKNNRIIYIESKLIG
ncbi:hypothetical protein JZU46_04615 [bacterium]|nr:hypothetical protein [bacterium]